jgi:hypothetical protein
MELDDGTVTQSYRCMISTRKGTMKGMDEAPEYDWVDDKKLDWAETMRRFEQLDPALVVTTPPQYHFATPPVTEAGGSEIVVRSFFASSG